MQITAAGLTHLKFIPDLISKSIYVLKDVFHLSSFNYYFSHYISSSLILLFLLELIYIYITDLQIGVPVALRSICDHNTIVAEGCLNRIDPNEDVGMQVLGENWCQVCVKVVLKDDELLVRPFDYCQTIGDAFGEEIAWPCDFVSIVWKFYLCTYDFSYLE